MTVAIAWPIKPVRAGRAGESVHFGRWCREADCRRPSATGTDAASPTALGTDASLGTDAFPAALGADAFSPPGFGTEICGASTLGRETTTPADRGREAFGLSPSGPRALPTSAPGRGAFRPPPFEREATAGVDRGFPDCPAGDFEVFRACAFGSAAADAMTLETETSAADIRGAAETFGARRSFFPWADRSAAYASGAALSALPGAPSSARAA
ncbi:hypothetical protein [Actinoplanes nipponensis]|uniref:hypothetical protein n=1 Tax=Actinoplanes nipponensis TaxID=135950 RepID=UPI0019457E6C|nr:hypothetical protein [Actinoplanes nipponensis]